MRIEGLAALAAGAALLHDPVRALHRLHAQHGPLIDIRPPRLKVGPGRATVLIADPRVARAMLQQPALFENVESSIVTVPPFTATIAFASETALPPP